MVDQKHIRDHVIGDPFVAVTLQIPASKEAVLRRCADLLASGSPQGRAIENIIRVVIAEIGHRAADTALGPDEFGSAA